MWHGARYDVTGWRLTIEFPILGQLEPVRFEAVATASDLFSPVYKSLKALREGDSVRIHYRKESPTEAAVDALSRRFFQSSKSLEW